MRHNVGSFTSLRLVLVTMMLIMTGCENGNLFGKLNKDGGSGTVDSLNLDGENALRNKDYSRAIAFYEAALSKQPNNAEALFGAASASIGSSGFNLGILMANLTNQLGASSVNTLSDLIASSRETLSVRQVGGTDGLLDGIPLDALNSVIDLAICRLRKIISGQATPEIPRDSINLFVNTGILCLLRLILRPLREQWLDIENTGGDYDIVVDQTVATDFCNPTNPNAAANSSFLQQMAQDAAGAYALFNAAVNKLNLTPGQSNSLDKIRGEIETAARKVLTRDASNGLPGDCIDLLEASGITASNFTANTEVIDIPPTGC